MDFKHIVLTLIISAVVWSLTSFSYINANFISKDIFDILIRRIDRIETKIDKLIENNNINNRR